jgi:hypothetical protein
MAALIREKKPVDLAVDDFLIHAYKLICCVGKVGRILQIALILGFIGRQIVPLFTGNLTTFAGNATGCVDKESFAHRFILCYLL